MKTRPAARATLAVLSVLLVLALLPADALAQIQRRQGQTMVRLRPQLKVQEFSGDMARWVTEMPLEMLPATPNLFSVQNPLTNVISMKWQVSDKEIPTDNTALDAPGTLGTGTCEVPEQGKARIFSIDLSKYLPASPPASPKKYYIRVVATQKSGDTPSAATLPPVASSSVTIRYQKPSGKTTIFTAEGLEQTVKQKHAWMYKNSPMPIEIDLEKLEIGNSNENADEPYLIVFVLYVDGTTINPLSFASSTVRIQSPTKTHGNIPDHDPWGKDLETGKVANIPNSTGHFETTIKPIGLEFAADLEDVDGSIGQSMKDNTMVILVVVALEEDATKTSSANAARNTAVQELQKKANAVIQSLTLQDLMKGNPPEFDIGQIQSDITSKALKAAKADTLDTNFILSLFSPLAPWAIAQAADPDDYIGAGYKIFTFGQLLDRTPPGKIPIRIGLANQSDWEGAYTVTGWIRRK
jgi:hypothetical protein